MVEALALIELDSVARGLRAWPVEWKGADLDCEDNNIPVEELTLVYDFLETEAYPNEEP